MSKEECVKIGYTYEEDGEKQCVTKEWCHDSIHFILDTRCVSAETCAKEKRYAYYHKHECSTAEPDANGHFD